MSALRDALTIKVRPYFWRCEDLQPIKTNPRAGLVETMKKIPEERKEAILDRLSGLDRRRTGRAGNLPRLQVDL